MRFNKSQFRNDENWKSLVNWNAIESERNKNMSEKWSIRVSEGTASERELPISLKNIRPNIPLMSAWKIWFRFSMKLKRNADQLFLFFFLIILLEKLILQHTIVNIHCYVSTKSIFIFLLFNLSFCLLKYLPFSLISQFDLATSKHLERKFMKNKKKSLYSSLFGELVVAHFFVCCFFRSFSSQCFLRFPWPRISAVRFQRCCLLGQSAQR